MKEGVDLDWLILDVDGVLIDVSDSYDKAVKLTVEYFLDGVDVDLDLVTKLRLKSALGDDYNLSFAFICGYESGDIETFIREFPAGGTMDRLLERYSPPISMDEVKARFDNYYMGDGQGDGLWKDEKKIVDIDLLDEAEEYYRLGVVTGRNRKEMELAEIILGYEFSNKVTSDEYLKPDPRALSSLVGDDDGVFIGDSASDEVLVERYNMVSSGKFNFLMVERDVADVNEAIRSLIKK